MSKKTISQFLVLYEDIWNIKQHFQTQDIKKTISEILENNDVVLEEDYDLDSKKTNDDFFSVGTFGMVFYDLSLYEKDNNEESAGRIMVFDLEFECDE